MDNNSFFVTTPIYYVNDVPHIGHAYTSIACDVLARFNRLNNKNTIFLTGTDEHGLKMEQAAKKKNMDTKKFVDEMSLNFKKLTKILNLTNDFFIRTTDEFHKKASQHIWNILEKNDQIYLDKYKGWYSISDEAYFNDNEISTDKKTKKKVAPSGHEVQWVEEESYFFKLSKWQGKLLDYYQKNPDFIGPESRKNEVISFVKNGLKDLSISRTTFSWGIQVPNNAKHVMYVWLDALINYLSAIGYPDKKYKKFWPANVHIIGKDIIRFHAVYWPAFLLAADIEPPKRIFAHGWWTNEGKKISKSLGNVIDPNEIIKTYGIDALRFFLLREVPFGNDGDFSKKSLQRRMNNDLANDLGNLVQRVLTIINKNLDGKLSKIKQIKENDKKIYEYPEELLKNIEKNYEKQEFHKVIENIWKLISKANKYVDESAPWQLIKDDRERAGDVLNILVIIIAKIAIFLAPIMPDISENILNKIGLSIKNLTMEDISKNNFLNIDHIIKKPEIIFHKIDNE
mgnify:FL=1